jgi:hypothetical protein
VTSAATATMATNWDIDQGDGSQTMTEIDMRAGEFGDRAVLDEDLSPDMVPSSADPWMPFAEFALSFDGYQYRGNLGEWANSQVDIFAQTKALPANLTLADLRALVFFEQRRWRHFDQMPTGEDAAHIEALLAEIRVRLETDTNAPQ